MFDGVTFNEERDGERLTKQLHNVARLMMDGYWHTLYEISGETGYPTQSIGSRLRDLRKPKNGGHFIERHYVADGVWEYRVACAHLHGQSVTAFLATLTP